MHAGFDMEFYFQNDESLKYMVFGMFVDNLLNRRYVNVPI